MKINEVERITGLTPKAIRLYEDKGLIRVSRNENGYRNYSEENIATLKCIKFLRSAGITLTDIKLYICGVVTIDELLDKRKGEILKESGKNSDQYQLCDRIAAKITAEDWENKDFFTESNAETATSYGTLSVGIDIGTTTISAVVFDIDHKKQVEAFTLPHHSYVASSVRSEQSVYVILEKAEKLLEHILNSYSGVISVGISGQMHGIVYVNKAGEPVSNLINWQDKRADQPLEDGRNTCQRIKEITGETVATGYGIATHYYNMLQGLVPADAAGFCTIMDLFGMRVCGLQKAVTHVSNGAAFGLFDVKTGQFKRDKLTALGIDGAFLPMVTGGSSIIGKYHGIPVSVALGDNQASFLGSVREHKSSILINIGTGSQISTVSAYCEVSPKVELRPFVEGKFLLCGSALCGGFAYSMLENFFRSYAVSAGMPEKPQYKLMNEMAAMAYDSSMPELQVDVSFCGKRWDPNARGSVAGIDRENFTPEALVLGVLKGMCAELQELYEEFPEKRSHIVASGGAVRKNEVLQKLLSEQFGMPISVNTQEEEAATGAALFSAVAIGRIAYKNGFSDYIVYQ